MRVKLRAVRSSGNFFIKKFTALELADLIVHNSIKFFFFYRFTSQIIFTFREINNTIDLMMYTQKYYNIIQYIYS